MINVIGHIFDTSGYSIHTRELVNALSKLTEVSLQTPLPKGWERMCNDKELEMIKKVSDEEVNLIITNPLHWKFYTNAKRNWAYLIWEGDKIPECYLAECLNSEIEYIIVPSEHTKKAILNTDSDMNHYYIDKIKVIPHGVDLEKFYPGNKSIENLKVQIKPEGEELDLQELPFIFFANKGFKDLEDRGGTQYLIQAYIEEFTNKDKVELLIKVNPAYGIPDLNKILLELGYKEGCPKIIFDIATYDYKELVKLYHKCDVFVGPTRSESFGIPFLEAMACGKPVITTDFGGQTDFCSMETGWIIGGELKEVEHDLQYEGIKWLTPDIKQLREAMRQAYEEKKELMDIYSKTALATAKLFTWNNTAKLIVSLLEGGADF